MIKAYLHGGKPFLMLQSFKQFFAFNKSDRAAAYLLALIIALLTAASYIYNELNRNVITNNNENSTLPLTNNTNKIIGVLNEDLSENGTQQKILNQDSILSINIKIDDEELDTQVKPKKEIDSPTVEKSKTFNPNVTTKSELMALGVNEYAASNWVNYLQKGGRIRKPEQMKTIYGVELHEYEKLLPLAEIDPFYSNIIEKDSTIVINLNTATYKELQKIKGIGEKRAKTIVQYRNRLGGYASVEQLKEIPRFPKKNFNKIAKQLKVEIGYIKKLNPNISNLANLVYHPYIDSLMANELLTQRENGIKFSQAIQLTKLKGFNQEKIKKLTPYLRFD